MRVKKYQTTDGSEEGLIYWCEGCKTRHSIRTKGNTFWEWNGDIDKPVITPSVLVTYPAVSDALDEYPEWKKERRCHAFIGCNGAKPGEIIFLSDCTHELRGQVCEFPEYPS